MYKHIAEAFVAVAHAQRVTENICARVQDFCQSTVSVDPDRLLDFGDGRVIIRPVDEGLLVHVSAEHLVIFYGIRALLEGSLINTCPAPRGQSNGYRPTERRFGRSTGTSLTTELAKRNVHRLGLWVTVCTLAPDIELICTGKVAVLPQRPLLHHPQSLVDSTQCYSLLRRYPQR